MTKQWFFSPLSYGPSYKPLCPKILLVAIVALFVSQQCQAEENERQYLLGDWGGVRSAWEEKGVSIESILTNDLIGNVSGGIDRTAGIVGNYDLTFTLDSGKLGWWENGTLFTYFLGNYGRNPTEFVGDLQGSDNIEAYDTFKLYEAWYSHSLFGDALNLLVGLYDYNSEFDALDYAGTLINSSFGISPDMSQVGPSIFPTTSLAVRARLNPLDTWYILTALYDGVPGDPHDQRGTHIRFGSNDGLFYALETGLVSPEDSRHYKAALGGWYHSAEFEDFNGMSTDENAGLYAIFEAMLLSEADSAQGLGAFFQSGFAPADRNQTAQYYGTGLSYTGLIPARDSDVLALGVAVARNGHDFRDANPDFELVEVATELTYRMELLPYLSVQPDVQFIANPGTDPTLSNAWVLGLRTEIGM